MSAYNFILATVLQLDNDNFVCNPCGGYGKVMPIPAENIQLGAEYWARPIKNDYFQGFRYIASANAPTFDSIRCFKLTNSITSQYFYVAGTIAAFTAAAATCCGASPAPSPIPSIVVTLADIAPCQNTCTSDGTKVSADGVLVNQQTFGTGSASIAALIIYLNANAASVGTWSNPGGNTIKLVTTVKKDVCFIACIKTA
jgi:hypothetical protein